MGRPRKFLIEDAKEAMPADMAEAVRMGKFPRADLPAMLADAKELDDQPLIAAILEACARD